MNPISAAYSGVFKSSANAPITGQPPKTPDAAMKIAPTSTEAPTRTAAGGAVRSADPVNATADARADSTVLHARPDHGSGVPFDSTRVAELRTAVSEGRYQPSAANIADALIGMDRAFAGVRS